MVQIRDEVQEPVPDYVKNAYKQYKAMKEDVERGIAELGPNNPVIAEIMGYDDYAKALRVYDRLQAIVEAGVMTRGVTDDERAQARKLDAFITGLLDEVGPMLGMD